MTRDRLSSLVSALPMRANEPELAVLSAQQFEPLIVINANTWHVLTDHARQSALATDQDQFNVILVNIPADQEIGACVAYSGGINANLAGIPASRADSTELARHVKNLYKTIQGRETLLAMGADADYWLDFLDFMDNAPDDEEEQEAVTALETVPNDFDIPELDINIQPSKEDVTTISQWLAYGSKRRDTPADGILFYVDDSRFKQISMPPGVRVAIEPNYSTDQMTPRALMLDKTWSKRAHAVEWQKQNIKPIVDLFVSRDQIRDNLIGVPRGWKCYANRYSAQDPDHLVEMYKLAQDHAGSEIIYCVYGTAGARAICEENNWIFIDSEQATGWKNGTTN